jgi:hypothetical protein
MQGNTVLQNAHCAFIPFAKTLFIVKKARRASSLSALYGGSCSALTVSGTVNSHP